MGYAILRDQSLVKMAEVMVKLEIDSYSFLNQLGIIMITE